MRVTGNSQSSMLLGTSGCGMDTSEDDANALLLVFIIVQSTDTVLWNEWANTLSMMDKLYLPIPP